MTSPDANADNPARPIPGLEWTGERYIPGVKGQIELEHVHRYLVARQLAHGKTVLDIACGEGYGANLLADVAAQVIGVDISQEAVAHARRTYPRRHLEFRPGSCSSIPVGDASIDLAVSFETLEHHAEHDDMMREIKRVLRPDGILLMSTPDRYQYSDLPQYRNPYHKKELYLDEFRALLLRFFRKSVLYGQAVKFASIVAPFGEPSTVNGFVTFHRDGDPPVAESGLARPVYCIALASDGEVTSLPASVFPGGDERLVTLEALAGNLQEALAAADASVTMSEARAAACQADLESARADRDAVTREAARVAAQLENATNRVTALSQHNARLDARVIETRGVVSGLESQLASTSAELVRMSQQVQRAEQRASQLAANLAVTEEHVQAIVATKSWRITAPMRQVGVLLRRVRGGLHRRALGPGRDGDEATIDRAALSLSAAPREGAHGRESLALYFRAAGLADPPASTSTRLREGGWPVFESREAAESVAALVRASGLFDADAYRSRFSRLDGLDPAVHYVVIGEALGAAPSDQFDPGYYRERYPDVARARVNALAHYASSGRSEGRRALSVASSLRFDRDRLRLDRDTILLTTHDASRTGAPILVYNLASQLARRYNVVGVLLADGELTAAFEDVCAAVVGPLGRENWNDLEARHLVAQLTSCYRPLFAIANSIESRIVMAALAHAFVPVTALIHEFPSYTRPEGTMGQALDWATQVVFSAHIVARAARREHPTLGGRALHTLRQGRCRVPGGESDAGPREEPARVDVAPPSPDGGDRARAAGVAASIGQAFRPPGFEDAIVVLGAGSVQLRKGIDLFISCAAAVAALGPRRPVRFVWIGHGYDPRHDAMYSSYLDDQIVHSGVDELVTILDAVADLDPIYAAADMFFLSSRLDPLPNVTIEAAWRGMPVVCFAAASGMAEVLTEDDTTRACVVPHLDVASAARVIAGLADDDEARRRIGHAIQRLARESFDMERYADQIERLGLESVGIVRQRRDDFVTIREHQAFDPTVYTAPGYPCASRDDAITRFLAQWTAVGLSAGAGSNALFRRPCAGFHPQVYACENHDGYDTAAVNPFAHFIRRGSPAGPWLSSLIAPDGAATRPGPSSSLRVALHGHFYFPELAGEFLAKLEANQTACDLLISTDSESKADLLRSTTAQYRRGTVQVAVVPNRGRDIGPLLSEFGDVTATYDVVGHLHAKRSLAIGHGTVGDTWREFLWQHLLGDAHAMMDLVLSRFAADQTLGLVFPADPHLSDWDANRDLAMAVAERMGISALPPFFDFPIGGMFWARSAALQPLFDLRLDWGDYPDEPIPEDATILHAIERLWPFVARKAGYEYATTHVPGVTW